VLRCRVSIGGIGECDPAATFEARLCVRSARGQTPPKHRSRYVAGHRAGSQFSAWAPTVKCRIPRTVEGLVRGQAVHTRAPVASRPASAERDRNLLRSWARSVPDFSPDLSTPSFAVAFRSSAARLRSTQMLHRSGMEPCLDLAKGGER
jgi:hypothetical protein